MHFAIDAGHNSPPGDTGAIGYVIEDNLTKELAAKISALLLAAGHQVTNCVVPKSKSLVESLKQRVAIANDSQAELYVSLHFNKFLPTGKFTSNPMGSEVYVASASGRKVGVKVMAELKKLGFAVHDAVGGNGVKIGSFYVLVQTQMPAILIESFFLDSKSDFNCFTKVGMDSLAAAIVKGLTA